MLIVKHIYYIICRRQVQLTLLLTLFPLLSSQEQTAMFNSSTVLQYPNSRKLKSRRLPIIYLLDLRKAGKSLLPRFTIKWHEISSYSLQKVIKKFPKWVWKMYLKVYFFISCGFGDLYRRQVCIRDVHSTFFTFFCMIIYIQTWSIILTKIQIKCKLGTAKLLILSQWRYFSKLRQWENAMLVMAGCRRKLAIN